MEFNLDFTAVIAEAVSFAKALPEATKKDPDANSYPAFISALNGKNGFQYPSAEPIFQLTGGDFKHGFSAVLDLGFGENFTKTHPIGLLSDDLSRKVPADIVQFYAKYWRYSSDIHARWGFGIGRHVENFGKDTIREDQNLPFRSDIFNVSPFAPISLDFFISSDDEISMLQLGVSAGPDRLPNYFNDGKYYFMLYGKTTLFSALDVFTNFQIGNDQDENHLLSIKADIGIGGNASSSVALGLYAASLFDQKSQGWSPLSAVNVYAQIRPADEKMVKQDGVEKKVAEKNPFEGSIRLGGLYDKDGFRTGIPGLTLIQITGGLNVYLLDDSLRLGFHGEFQFDTNGKTIFDNRTNLLRGMTQIVWTPKINIFKNKYFL